MVRRTITFTEGIEDGVRERQIEMMRSLKRDVSFTEAVNYVLLQGLLWNASAKGISGKELGRQCLQWVQGMDKIDVEAFLDSIPSTVVEERDYQ